ncbi:MAG: hypothetical protein WDW36_009257 [Sanguina aurantia]
MAPSMDVRDYCYAVPTAQQQSAAVLQLAQAMFTAFSCQHPSTSWGLNGGTFSMNAPQVPVAAPQAQPDSQVVKNAKCPAVKAALGKATKSPTSSSSGASTDTKDQPSVLTRRGRSGTVLRQQQTPSADGASKTAPSSELELSSDPVMKMLEEGDSFLQDGECASRSSTGTRSRCTLQASASLPFLIGGGLDRAVGVPTAPRTYTHKRKLSTLLTDACADAEQGDTLLCGQSAPLPSSASSFRHPGCVGAAVSARLSWSPPSTSEEDSARYSKDTQLASLTADDLLLLAMLQPSSHASGEFGWEEVERAAATMCIDDDMGGKAILFPSGLDGRGRIDSLGSGSLDSCMSGLVGAGGGAQAAAGPSGFAKQGSGALSYSDTQDCFSMEEETCFLGALHTSSAQQQFAGRKLAAPVIYNLASAQPASLPLARQGSGDPMSCDLFFPFVSGQQQQQPLQHKAVSALTSSMGPLSNRNGMKGLASFNALDALTDIMQDGDSASSNGSWGMAFDGLMEFDASDLFADL